MTVKNPEPAERSLLRAAHKRRRARGYDRSSCGPPSLGATNRELVVLPTNTWQAYNFHDATATATATRGTPGAPNGAVELDRPTSGAACRRASSVRPAVPALALPAGSRRSTSPTPTSRGSRTATSSRTRTTPLVFSGHQEYVTPHEYDVVEAFRDLGGNLMFLSANNFFWRVERTGNVLRDRPWRNVGRPEARLIGVQYLANDDGQRQGAYTSRRRGGAWLFDGTGLVDGSTFGETVGGYGIEIDATTPDSPRDDRARAGPGPLRPGITAQMTYYETPAGAKVFAAGTLDFGGSATFWPMTRILDNLWARLSQP